MSLWTSLQESLVSAVRHGRLWLAQFIGNALLAMLFVWFLHIRVSHWYNVALNFVVACACIVGFLLLHGGTLAAFSPRANSSGIKDSFRRALRHIPALLSWAVIFWVVLALIAQLDDYHYAFPGYVGSIMPAWLRRPFGREGLFTTYDSLVALLRWVVIPGLMLPFAASAARQGFKGFIDLRAWARTIGNPAWWIVLIIASILGVYCTGKMMEWRLNSQATLFGETWWLGFRLIIAYVMALFSWLWVCAILGRSQSEPDTQANHAAA